MVLLIKSTKIGTKTLALFCLIRKSAMFKICDILCVTETLDVCKLLWLSL